LALLLRRQYEFPQCGINKGIFCCWFFFGFVFCFVFIVVSDVINVVIVIVIVIIITIIIITSIIIMTLLTKAGVLMTPMLYPYRKGFPIQDTNTENNSVDVALCSCNTQTKNTFNFSLYEHVSIQLVQTILSPYWIKI
jgi:hypothetical protein